MTDTLPVFSWFDTRALGPPDASGVIRRESADFQVDEILGFEPDGEGDHLLLWVEKTDCNTNWVAGQLARQAGLQPRDLGFSGLKDRWAITRQYFSVPASGGSCEQWSGWESEGFKVLAATRHRRKLRRGSHQGNRFQLRVRELQGDRRELERRLQVVVRGGVPNYFGEQRFGRDMGNLALAQRVLSDPRRRWHRNEREFAFSAARSALFNEVLARRIREGSWNILLPGELAMLEGSRSVFLAEEIDQTLQDRLASGDIGPSGPLAGESAMQAGGLAGALEQEVLAGYSHWVDGLCASRVKADRRRLVLKLPDLQWRIEDQTMELSFTLPSACFATAVLRELLSYSEANPRSNEA